MTAHGQPGLTGERNPAARLTENQVAEIRQRWRDGEKQTHIAAHYGVGHVTVHQIVSRKTWRHV